MSKKKKIAPLNEEMITKADTVLKSHLMEYGTSGTDGARRRALLGIYSCMTGIGAPAAEFDKALSDQKASMLADAEADGQPFDDDDFDDVDTTEEDFADEDDEDEDEEDFADDTDPDAVSELIYDVEVLNSYNVEELKVEAAKHKIEGRSNMNKDQLIAALSALTAEATSASE